jgi:hypothetical protein
LAIFVLVLWLATAAAGIALLRAGGAARRDRLAASAPAAVAADGAANRSDVAGNVPASAVATVAAAGTVPTAGTVAARLAARPLAPDGKPPSGPHIRVPTPDGEHPLLEFSHPALAVTGIACWMMFAFVHYRPLAWIAVAILLATLLLGLGWFIRNRQAARRRAAAAWSFPSRLVWLHGAVAGSSLVLAVLAALVAARG